MSWLEKLLPPRIQRSEAAARKTMPEGLWVKCPSCEAVLYRTDLESNLHVCPKCSHHMDRFLGLVFGLLRGVVLLGVFVILGQLLRLDGEKWWTRSLLIPYGESVANGLRGLVGEERVRRSGLSAHRHLSANKLT